MKFWQVDSFAENIFEGNPAAVFIFEQAPDEALMRNLAMEMNLSESAFVTLGEETSIRWFTPNSEVNLCGHATLAAAHILWEEGFIKEDIVNFNSKSGTLTVKRERSGYSLNFPRQPAEERLDYLKEVEGFLGCKVIFVGSNGEDCMAVISDDNFLRSFEPPLAEISKLAERGFLLTARDSSGKFDYIYRSFFPKLNIPEDPVTGAANTCLAPYWAAHLQKDKLTTFQASARGGEIGLEMLADRVLISGKARTVFEGVMKGVGRQAKGIGEGEF